MVASAMRLRYVGPCLLLLVVGTPLVWASYQRRKVVSYFQYIPLSVQAVSSVPAPGPSSPPVSRASQALVAGPPLVLEGPPQLANNSARSEPTHVALLRTRCASCHTSGRKTAGGVSLFGADGQFAPNRKLWDLYDAVASGAMPPGSPLSAADKQLLRQTLQSTNPP